MEVNHKHYYGVAPPAFGTITISTILGRLFTTWNLKHCCCNLLPFSRKSISEVRHISFFRSGLHLIFSIHFQKVFMMRLLILIMDCMAYKKGSNGFVSIRMERREQTFQIFKKKHWLLVILGLCRWLDYWVSILIESANTTATSTLSQEELNIRFQ